MIIGTCRSGIMDSAILVTLELLKNDATCRVCTVRTFLIYSIVQYKSIIHHKTQLSFSSVFIQFHLK